MKEYSEFESLLFEGLKDLSNKSSDKVSDDLIKEEVFKTIGTINFLASLADIFTIGMLDSQIKVIIPSSDEE